MGFVAVDRAGFDEGTPRGWWASSLLGLLCAVGAYLYMGVYQGFMCAVVLNAVVLPGVYHKAVLVLCLCFASRASLVCLPRRAGVLSATATPRPRACAWACA